MKPEVEELLKDPIRAAVASGEETLQVRTSKTPAAQGLHENGLDAELSSEDRNHWMKSTRYLSICPVEQGQVRGSEL